MSEESVTMNVTLSKELEAFVAAQVAAGGHASTSDFVAALVSRARLEHERDTFEGELVQALEKKDFVPVTAEFWEGHERRLREHLAKKHAVDGQRGRP